MSRAHPDCPFIATGMGRSAERRPLWIMRQAGRYLPEYRAMRQEYSFQQMCNNPEAAAEVTLQPLRRFDLDAAILFTDLLIPIVPMGLPLDYDPGPVLSHTVSTDADIEALKTPDPERDLAPMLETARLVRSELDESKALIGFVGAPFTMACYMVEGRGSKNWDKVRRLLHEQPETFDRLMGRIVTALEPLVASLVASGCDAIQIFDSWASVLDSDSWSRHCAPYTDRLLSCAMDSGALAIHYVNGAGHHIERMQESRADILGVDWRVPMAQVRRRAPERVLQGNLDPTALFSSPDRLRESVRAICRDAGSKHVFNLGHGILPQTDPSVLEQVVETVHQS